MEKWFMDSEPHIFLDKLPEELEDKVEPVFSNIEPFYRIKKNPVVVRGKKPRRIRFDMTFGYGSIGMFGWTKEQADWRIEAEAWRRLRIYTETKDGQKLFPGLKYAVLKDVEYHDVEETALGDVRCDRISGHLHLYKEK